MGGTAFNKDGAQIIAIVGDPQTAFYRQHDARFRPNGDISLFDNHGAGATSERARGIEYQLNLSLGIAQVVWQYLGDAKSNAMGSFRRFADGDNVIDWGFSTSTSNVAWTEVDAAGQDLLDMSFVTRGNWAYRSVKVPLDTYDVAVLRNTAGLP